MSNLKVSNKSGPVVHGDHSADHSHSTHHTDSGGDVHDQRHALDNTPVQHRELETHGVHVRARVEGRSDNELHKGHFKHSNASNDQPGDRTNSQRPGSDFEGNHGSLRSRENHSHSESNHIENQESNWRELQQDGNSGRSRSSNFERQGNNWRGLQQEGNQNNRSFRSNNFGFDNNPASHQHSDHSTFNARIGETVRSLRNEVGNILRGQNVPEGERLRLGSNYAKPRIERIGENQRNHLNHPDFFNESRGPKHDKHGYNVEHEFRHQGFEFHKDGFHELNHSIRLLDKIADRLSERVENRLQRGESPTSVTRQTLADARDVARLNKHFAHLFRTGGEPVARAYRAAIEFLLNVRNPEVNRLRLASELLRDLRTGAFLHPLELESPFPLTGRARVVSEMMALMRTLDAIERFAQEMKVPGRTVFNGEVLNFPLGTVANTELAELFSRLLVELGPMFPGIAGRLEIPRVVASLGGMLMDAQGRPLLTSDRMPLRLGELLWLNTWIDSSGSFGVLDRFAARFSPLFLHGFDAVYSVIGFDGRSLSMPRFMAIQSQINGSQSEWMLGQAPLTEGWVRAAIELLKDSISVEHNVLGESLEEALTGDRLHFIVMRGTVEDGVAVPGSFTFSRAYS